jgi:ATP-binding cassette subfamily E protein 1
LPPDESTRVDTYLAKITSDFGTSYWTTEIALPLQLDKIMSQNLLDLSGGERQRVAIAACLSTNADLYLLDEPSAHLDVEQRSQATRAIRRFAEHTGASVMVIDHDIYMLDLLVNRLLVFSGTSSKSGTASAPTDMRTGMNEFLSNLGITFRRDERTQRPRFNKPGSQKDKEQIKSGEYYYLPAG